MSTQTNFSRCQWWDHVLYVVKIYLLQLKGMTNLVLGIWWEDLVECFLWAYCILGSCGRKSAVGVYRVDVLCLCHSPGVLCVWQAIWRWWLISLVVHCCLGHKSVETLIHVAFVVWHCHVSYLSSCGGFLSDHFFFPSFILNWIIIVKH